MMKLSFLLFILVLSLTSLPQNLTGIVNETGSFRQFLMGTETNCAYDNWLSHISEGLARPGYNDYPRWDRQTVGFGTYIPPDETQGQNWSTISSFFCNQQWAAAESEINGNRFPYDVVNFTDTDTGRTYYMLRERLGAYYDDNGTVTTTDDEDGSFDYGWGLVVFNPNATSPTVIMVPHPNDDYIGIPLAWKAFTTLNARYLMINGAGREVYWTNEGEYDNTKALSDPSRNALHPLNLTYMLCCDEIRSLLTAQNATIKREFSMQTHSYDTNLHLNYANCQVSAGNGQSCPNLPIRDLALSGTDVINSAPYIIHPANSIGTNSSVLGSNFWCVNYSIHPFQFNDGINQFTVSNRVDLPGYGANCQMLYSIDGWNSFDVFDPFFHIEMDELPDCYPQTEEMLAWFYGWNTSTQTWDLASRYDHALAYYQPWVYALQNSLSYTYQLNDNLAPSLPVITNATITGLCSLQLAWQRTYEYDFKSWIISLERLIHQGGGVFTVVDTLVYTRDILPKLADQACTGLILPDIPVGFYYKLRMAAVDYSGRSSAYSEPVMLAAYASAPMVTNLRLKNSLSDATHITVEWNPVPSQVLTNGYRIERRNPGTTNWELRAILPQYSSRYTDTSFPNPDTLTYDYRVVTLGYNNQTFIPNTCFRGYFRAYTAPQNIAWEFINENQMRFYWNPVTTTLSGQTNTPDYYELIRSDTPDPSQGNSNVIIVNEAEYWEPIDPNPEFGDRWFFTIRAKANTVSP